jgi:integrase
VSAAASLRVEDYFEHGKRAWLRLHEKGGKRHEVPCHHNLAASLDAWIGAAGIAADKKGLLFRAIRKGNKLTENPMARSDILAMIKRRAAGAACPIPPAATHFAQPASRHICRTAARLNTPSRSPHTNRHVPRSFMTERKMRSRWMRLSGSGFEETAIHVAILLAIYQVIRGCESFWIRT